MGGASLRLVVLAFSIVLGSVSGLASDLVPMDRDARTLHAVLDRIAKSYVEPSRVDSRKMLWAAARSLDRDVPEVLLEAHESQGAMTLRVSGEHRTFSAEGVRSLRELDATVRDVLRFVGEHRSPSSKPNAEYVAINGILATLDPHSLLLDPTEAREMATMIASRLFGIGVVFDSRGSPATGAEPGVPVVMTVIKGGPAEEAGIGVCDRILAVEDQWATNLDWQDLSRLIRGPVGSPVWLTLRHDGAVKDVVVTRAEVKFATVESRRLDGDVGLVRIFGFGGSTGAEVRSALESLKKDGARSFILDLRQNAGGLLAQAIETASIFVRSGPIVSTVGEGDASARRARRNGSFRALSKRAP